LQRLFPWASFVGCADIRVIDATERSDECGPHSLFAAIRGSRVHGADYVNDAIDRGALALLVDCPQPHVRVPQCVVQDVRRSFAELCAALAGHPSRRIHTCGITGTNGKSTVSWLVRSILTAAQRQTGLLGTIEYHDGLRSSPSALTTPDARKLASHLAAMVQQNTTHAVIELSSHGLDQNRIAGTELDVAVITNVTQDHFDYHGDMQSYSASKMRIAEHCKPGGTLVVNQDDPGCRELVSRLETPVPLITYGLEQPADVVADVLEETLSGSRIRITLDSETIEVHVPLVARHNVSNALAAAVVCRRLGCSLQEIQAGIESLAGVPGRLERIPSRLPIHVFVDYAHTDDALRRCVRFLRSLTTGRVICVFGAGGDRDRLKRPLLAKAAAEAELAVVTSDNPRSEEPMQIANDILAGFAGSHTKVHVELDRGGAIRWALRAAQPGDCVLIAGKGHESVQVIGAQQRPFDDRLMAGQALLELEQYFGQPARKRA
jgi:UDP-N-acetylmuramoyl-L-alanyl-D-glutamate--2,6-diaminopimelate ligase